MATPSRWIIPALLAAAFFGGRLSVREPPSEAAERGESASGAPRVEKTNAPDARATRDVAGFDAAAASATDKTAKDIVALAATEPPGLSRLALLHAALQRIDAENWRGAFDLMSKARAQGMLTAEEERYVLERLGEVAGATACDRFKPADPLHNYEISSGRFAMKGWAEKNPDAAWAYIEALPESRFREGMTIGFALGAGLRDPARALKTMRAIPSPTQAQLLRTALGGDAGFHYSDLAQQWLEESTRGQGAAEYRDGDPRGGVFEAMLSAQVRALWKDPGGGRLEAWLDRFAGMPFVGARSIEQAAATIAARSDGPQALEWVERFSRGQPEASAGAVRQLMGQFAGRDPVAAAGWLDAHRESAIYDEAVETFLGRKRGELDAATALAWAGTIRSEDRRRSVIEQLSARIKSLPGR